MVDYIKSFQVGLDLAKAAERNRAEITNVFDALNEQLAKATQNTVVVQREEFDEKRNPLEMFLTAPSKYWAISARHKIHKAAQTWELARWSQGAAGYPCTVTQRDREFICENKEALESALEALLQDPFVGKAFLNLMSHEPPAT